MTNRKKIAILGGSAFSTPGFFKSLARSNDVPSMEVALHGRNQNRLKKIQRILCCEPIMQHNATFIPEKVAGDAMQICRRI